MLGVSKENIKLFIHQASRRLGLAGSTGSAISEGSSIAWDQRSRGSTVQEGAQACFVVTPLSQGQLFSSTGWCYLYQWSEKQGAACMFIARMQVRYMLQQWPTIWGGAIKHWVHMGILFQEEANDNWDRCFRGSPVIFHWVIDKAIKPRSRYFKKIICILQSWARYFRKTQHIDINCQVGRSYHVTSSF